MLIDRSKCVAYQCPVDGLMTAKSLGKARLDVSKQFADTPLSQLNIALARAEQEASRCDCAHKSAGALGSFGAILQSTITEGDQMGEPKAALSAFSWNVGSWFGAQLGCTLWMLILGLLLLTQSPLTAWTALAGFTILNVWGLYLWRCRSTLAAYAGLQRLLLAVAIVFAVLTLVPNQTGATQVPVAGVHVSTYLPHWVVLTPLALMLMFYLQERAVRRLSSGPNSTPD